MRKYIKILKNISQTLTASVLLLAAFLLSMQLSYAQSASPVLYSQETIDECLVTPYPDQNLQNKSNAQWRETDPIPLIHLDSKCAFL